MSDPNDVHRPLCLRSDLFHIVPESVTASDQATCRICMESEPCEDLFRPCLCRGTMKYVHKACLQHWRSTSSNRHSYYRCDQCHYRYNIRRVDAVGILNLPGMAMLITLCALVVCLGASTLLASLLVGKSPRHRDVLFTGTALFGFFSFFALSLTEDGGLFRSGFDFLSKVMRSSSIDNFVSLFIVVIVAVMAVLGLIMAPYFIYRFVVLVSTAGLRALETYVLEIHDDDPASARSTDSVEKEKVVGNGEVGESNSVSRTLMSDQVEEKSNSTLPPLREESPSKSCLELVSPPFHEQAKFESPLRQKEGSARKCLRVDESQCNESPLEVSTGLLLPPFDDQAKLEPPPSQIEDSAPKSPRDVKSPVEILAGCDAVACCYWRVFLRSKWKFEHDRENEVTLHYEESLRILFDTQRLNR